MREGAAFQLEVFGIKDVIFFPSSENPPFLSTDPLETPGPQFESPAPEGAVFQLTVSS